MDTSKFLTDNLGLMAMAFVSGGLLIWPLVKNRASGPSVNAFEATRLVNREKGVFIDVREAGEFAAGHVSGATNIPQASLASSEKALPKDKNAPVILVCATGSQAARAAAELRAAGYSRAVTLAGGLAGWRDAAMPVQKAA